MIHRPKRSGTTKDKSVEQERRIAKSFGGRVTPGSGALSIKGDVQTQGMNAPLSELAAGELIEAKTTSKTQVTIKLDWLQKLEAEARAAGKRPVLIIEIANEGVRRGMETEYVLIPRRHYEILRGENND